MSKNHIYSNSKVSKSSRIDKDFYPTPQWAVDAHVEIYDKHIGLYTDMMDFGANTGIYGATVRQLVPDVIIHGIEYDRTVLPKENIYDMYYYGDAAELPFENEKYNVIGNPPYKNFRRYHKFLLSCNTACLLLPLTYLTSKTRYDTINKYLFHVGIFVNRINFKEHLGQNSPIDDHAVFCYDFSKEWKDKTFDYIIKPQDK